MLLRSNRPLPRHPTPASPPASSSALISGSGVSSSRWSLPLARYPEVGHRQMDCRTSGEMYGGRPERRAKPFAMSLRSRPVVGTTSLRRRRDVAPLSARHRIPYVAQRILRCHSEVAPLSLRHPSSSPRCRSIISIETHTRKRCRNGRKKQQKKSEDQRPSGLYPFANRGLTGSWTD